MDAVYRQVRRWFALNREERRLLGGILAIALVGVVSRHLYLKHKAAAAAEPPAAEHLAETADE